MHKTPWFFFLALALLVLSGNRLRADPPSADDRAAELVRKLGSRSFKERDRATKELLQMGLAARKAIEAGIRSNDVEIRKRCELLLPDILQAQLRAKLDAFLADKEGKIDHDLPGWKKFQTLIGNDADSRKFYADMFLQNMILMESVDKAPEKAVITCHERCQELQTTLNQNAGRGEVSLLELGPLFFVGAVSKIRDGQHETVYQLSSFFYRPNVRNQLTATGAPSPFKKLVLAWMNSYSDHHAFGNILSSLSQLKLPEITEMAIKIIKEKKGGPQGIAHAMVMVAQSDGKKHLALFETFLKDSGQVSGFGIGNALRGETQVRDVALAMLVHLTEQKHADYDFTFSREPSYSLLFNAPFLGFSSKEEREAAFKKWDEWKAKQKK